MVTVVEMEEVVGSVQEAVVTDHLAVEVHPDRVEAAVSVEAWEAPAEVVLVVLEEEWAEDEVVVVLVVIAVVLMAAVEDHLEVDTGKKWS